MQVLELWYQGGKESLGGGAMNPNDAMFWKFNMSFNLQ